MTTPYIQTYTSPMFKRLTQMYTNSFSLDISSETQYYDPSLSPYNHPWTNKLCSGTPALRPVPEKRTLKDNLRMSIKALKIESRSHIFLLLLEEGYKNTQIWLVDFNFHQQRKWFILKDCGLIIPLTFASPVWVILMFLLTPTPPPRPVSFLLVFY